MAYVKLQETPYKGLVPYAESDYRFFFGREAERDIITANIMGSRLTVVYGPSGVGKSSVLRAGVVHGLRELAREELAAYGRPKFVVVFFNEWRDDPLTGLRNEIRRSVQNAVGATTLLIPRGTSFPDELKMWSEYVEGKLLIILDQFEEYFLYPQKEGEGSFAQEFPNAVVRSDVRTNFIVSLREDWYTKLDRFKVTITNLFDNNLRLDWLNREGARDAIEKPIGVYNDEARNGHPQVTINPGFTDKVLDQLEALADRELLGDGSAPAKGRGGSSSIQTPYLQLVLSRLWCDAVAKRPAVLDPSMLEAPLNRRRASSRSQEIIQSHLDSVMQTLAPVEQDIAARAFHYLVTPGGTKIAQQIGDLKDYTGVPEETLNDVLQKLSRKEMSILSQLVPPPNRPANQIRYELFHDVLAAAILDWRGRFNGKQAKAKAKAEATAKLQQERIEAQKLAAARELQLRDAEERAEIERQRAEDQKQRAAAETRERQAQEQRAETEQRRAEEHIRASKRLRVLSRALSVLVLITVGFGVTAAVFWRKASINEQLAREGQETAQKNELIAQDNEQKARRYAEESNQLRIAGTAAEASAKQMRDLADARLNDAVKAKGVAAAAQSQARIDRRAAEVARNDASNSRAEALAMRVEAENAREDANASRAQAGKAHELNVLYQEAIVRYRNKDYRGAIETFSTALPLIEDDIDRAYALTLIGSSYVDLKDPLKAIASFNGALELFQTHAQTQRKIDTLRNLGDAWSLMAEDSDKAKAVQYYTDAAAGYERIKAFDNAAKAHMRIVALHDDIKDIKIKRAFTPKPAEAYDSAISAYLNAGNSSAAADTLLALGRLYVVGSQDYVELEPDKARDAYERALKIFEQQNDLKNAGDTQLKIANLFDDSEDEAKRKISLDAYADAARSYQAAKLPRDAGKALSKLASLQARSNPSLAQKTYEAAVKEFESAGDASGAAGILRALARLYNCRDCDISKKKIALEYYRQLVSVYERKGALSAVDRRSLMSGLSSIVTIYGELGDKKAGDEYAKRLAALQNTPN